MLPHYYLDVSIRSCLSACAITLVNEGTTVPLTNCDACDLDECTIAADGYYIVGTNFCEGECHYHDDQVTMTTVATKGYAQNLR